MSGKVKQVVKVVNIDPVTGEELSEETASPMGDMVSFMRELMHGFISAGRVTSEVNETLMSELRDMRRSRREDTEAHIKTVHTLERLLSEERERQRLDDEARLNREIKERTANEVLTLAPIVAQKLMGMSAIKGAPDSVKGLIASIDPDQLDFDKRTITLSEAQLASLSLIIGEYQAQEEAKEKEELERA